MILDTFLIVKFCYLANRKFYLFYRCNLFLIYILIFHYILLYCSRLLASFLYFKMILDLVIN